MNKINEILKEFNYTHLTAATIDGKDCNLTSAQVRALQILCSRESMAGRYEEFLERYIVYNSLDREEKMIFNPNGTFRNEFKRGFYEVEDSMAMTLLFK